MALRSSTLLRGAKNHTVELLYHYVIVISQIELISYIVRGGRIFECTLQQSLDSSASLTIMLISYGSVKTIYSRFLQGRYMQPRILLIRRREVGPMYLKFSQAQW
ncbi:hypothetical protein FOXYSP1_13631 [Fusarium oxysporum f. sp. phaseoli]